MINWGSIATDLINQVLPIVISTLVAILAAFAVKAVKAATAYYETKTSEGQRYQIEAVINTAVTMAEQLWKGHPEIQAAGLTKLHLAEAAAHEYLGHYGIEVDPHNVETLVEAAVYDNFNRYKNKTDEFTGRIDTSNRAMAAKPADIPAEGLTGEAEG